MSRYDAVIAGTEALLAQLNDQAVAPCDNMTGQLDHSCLQYQEAKGGERPRRWPDFRPEEMCNSCAAYWYVSQADFRLRQARTVDWADRR